MKNYRCPKCGCTRFKTISKKGGRYQCRGQTIRHDTKKNSKGETIRYDYAVKCGRMIDKFHPAQVVTL